MKIVLIQSDIVWADPKANVARTEAALQALPADVDLIVLPEMFSTGFATQPEGVAEVEPGSTLQWMLRTARRHNFAVAGSVAIEDVGAEGMPCFRNRFYFVKPDGSVEHYDKHHLFTYGGEHLRYSAGNERVVVEWRGVRFLLMVCYDLRFPCWSRNREDYDCALYVASWPTPRKAAWTALLHARAIENQCYVVGVNRVGTDPYCHYSGGSVAIDPYGRDIVACADGQEGSAIAEIDMTALAAFRDKFPVLKDRDMD
ncbi:MAG: amidohydrolase [Bacteroidaceae bacterium]|nr:amidohydrolase [Bacteroidaceae bacterium]